MNNDSRCTSLTVRECDACTIEAFAEFASTHASGPLIGFIQGPGQPQWLAWDTTGRWVPSTTEWNSALEMRLFDGQNEWRWVTGQAAWLTTSGSEPTTSEGETASDGGAQALKWSEPRTRALEFCQEQTYLLWGRATGPREGHSTWSILSDPRIGTVSAPVALPAGRSARLRVLECFARADEYGNVALVDELLIALEAAEVQA